MIPGLELPEDADIEVVPVDLRETLEETGVCQRIRKPGAGRQFDGFQDLLLRLRVDHFDTHGVG